MLHNYNGQILQDKFVVSVLKNKQNGYFIEIGSNHPKLINNTYVLEKELNWKGIMVEYDKNWIQLYKIERPNSIYVINDATQINYNELFKQNNVPKNIDYLQIDLEVCNRSTLTTLELFNDNIFNEYKFATVTFEHDIYDGDPLIILLYYVIKSQKCNKSLTASVVSLGLTTLFYSYQKNFLKVYCDCHLNHGQ